MRASRATLAVALVSFFASACAYRSVPEKGLCRVRTIRTKPFEGSRVFSNDVEGIAYENGSDNLWIGDDNANQIYIIESENGKFLGRLRERDFEAAFPEAKDCDNGSEDVECSFTAELESLGYDRKTRSLYVVNTVNKLSLDPAVDKPALFRLTSAAKGENLRFKSWQQLEPGYKYGPIAVRGGDIYLAIGREVRGFDLEANHFTGGDWGEGAEVEYKTPHFGIVGMVFQGPYLWLLSQDSILSKVDWRTREEVEKYDLSGQGLNTAKGLAYGRGEFYVVEGDAPNPIYVLRFATSPNMSRAAFLGGWPRSCPTQP
jgi:hypothetical protein